MTVEEILTLRELIDECGDSFWSLTRLSSTGQWHAHGGIPGVFAYGKTPEEAVENLRVKLQRQVHIQSKKMNIRFIYLSGIVLFSFLILLKIEYMAWFHWISTVFAIGGFTLFFMLYVHSYDYER